MKHGSDRETSPGSEAVEDVATASDERLIATYRRLSRDLRLADDQRPSLYQKMFEVETAMVERGLDADQVAREVQTEYDEFHE